jgi:hypothetical protein
MHCLAPNVVPDAHSEEPFSGDGRRQIVWSFRAAHTFDAGLDAHHAIPARLPLAQVNPGQQILDTEAKLIHHAIRIAAYNTARSLARAIVTDTGYTRADAEAHSLIHTALASSGDMIPERDTVHLRLDPLPAPRHTAAIDELCHVLNDTNTIYPGTGLTLRHSIKPTEDRTPITELCQESWGPSPCRSPSGGAGGHFWETL